MAQKQGFERFWDMSFGGNDTSNDIPRGFAVFLAGLVQLLCKILFRISVKNQEIISAFKGKERGAVIVAPHVSYLDVAIMFLSVRPTKQWVRLIGRDTLFKGILGWILSRVGAFPIKRDTADRTAIKRATKMLKNGELIGVFPEGTRRGKGSKTPDIHGGAALIARMGKAPLVPLGLKNLELVKQKGKRVRFPRITAVFGEPISVDAFNFLPKDERLDACMWYVLRESFALSHDILAEEVDMAALFPESKDYTDVFCDHIIERVNMNELKEYSKG